MYIRSGQLRGKVRRGGRGRGGRGRRGRRRSEGGRMSVVGRGRGRSR